LVGRFVATVGALAILLSGFVVVRVALRLSALAIVTAPISWLAVAAIGIVAILLRRAVR